MCVWEGIKENRLSPEYVDVILGLMHLYRVLHVLALFALLGSGWWFFLLACTVQWDFNVHLYGTPCALNAKFHILPIQLPQCS